MHETVAAATLYTSLYEGHAGFYGLFWATSVQYNEDKSPGTWHWIEQA